MSVEARGRGRVVPRAANLQTAAVVIAPSPAQAPSLPLPAAAAAATGSITTTAGALQPQQEAEASSSSDWRCAGFVTDNSKPVRELPASKLSGGTASRLLSSGQPLLLKQLHLARCSLQQLQQQPAAPHSASAAQPQQLQKGGTQDDLQLPVLVSPADANRFLRSDTSKNTPGSYYHVRKPETSTVALTFNDWLQCWQSWTTNRLLLQAHVCNWELSSSSSTSLRVWPNKAVHPHLTQLLQVTPVSPPSSTAAPSSSTESSGTQQQQPATQHILDWALLQQVVQAGHWAPTGSLHLLAGGSDALLPARYETHDRLLCQVSGRQRLLLLAPDQAFAGAYPYPVHHPYDRYSAVDWEEPELEHWPAAAQVQGLLCDLAPGDTLVVPAYFFVHSQLMQPACVALEVALTQGPDRLSSPAALLLQASRMLEVWFGAEAGPANIRKWLLALSEGREWQLLEPQLLTSKGYKLLQCCHTALEQLQKLLALKPSTVSNTTSSSNDSCSASAQDVLESAARQLMGAMCDGRLVPTPWLNEGITDPLYLQYPPQYHLIEEDAEAARYSSLFRHRLIANRPDWMDHATPLQLAPAGSKRSLIKAAAAAEVQALPAE